MKVVLFLVAFLAITLIVEAKPPIPPNFPEELKADFDAIDAEVDKLPKDANGFPDFSKASDALKARMEKLKTDYETKTGNKWPMPSGPPSN